MGRVASCIALGTACTTLSLETLGTSKQLIGPKQQDAKRALGRSEWWKERAKTELDRTVDPFVEAEINEHKV